MHRRRSITSPTLIATAACAAALAGCSSSSNNGNLTGTNSTVPPQSVQTQVATAVASNIAAQIQAFTTTGVTPFLVLANRLPTKTPVINLGFLKSKSHAFPLQASCPTQTPTNPLDTDEDGIPDTVTDTFTAANCTESNGGSSFVISGTIAIGDPTPTTPDLAYNAGLSSFEIQETGSSEDVTVTFNGSVSIAETLSSITENANYNFTGSVTPSGGSTSNYSFMDNLTATYSFAATSSLLVEGDDLPAGMLNLTGSETATYGSNSYTFTLATPGGLTINPSCATAVTAGVLNVTFSGASTPAVITWTACGVYTVAYA